MSFLCLLSRDLGHNMKSQPKSRSFIITTKRHKKDTQAGEWTLLYCISVQIRDIHNFPYILRTRAISLGYLCSKEQQTNKQTNNNNTWSNRQGVEKEYLRKPWMKQYEVNCVRILSFFQRFKINSLRKAVDIAITTNFLNSVRHVCASSSPDPFVCKSCPSLHWTQLKI